MAFCIHLDPLFGLKFVFNTGPSLRKVFTTGQTVHVSLPNLVLYTVLSRQGDENMFGIVAAVLFVLWLLGILVFHMTTAFIDPVLIVSVIFLVLHLISGRAQTDTCL